MDNKITECLLMPIAAKPVVDTHPVSAKGVKAVGLISGGLDSTVAARVIRDLGVEVHGVYFSMPWGCCDKDKAQQAAEKLGIKFIIMQLDDRYLEIVKKPKYGYGSALNPCVDCRIHMFSRAGQYMKSIGADFVFTGEVLGQRPMSQMRKSMRWIEEETGLQGLLVRPLCAQLLEPTLPEQKGLIDRAKLLNISGRSRKEQIQLANDYGITDYPVPAGGCLLTDQNFARRMKDAFQYGYRSFRETIALKWGRHFRVTPNFKVIIGRDEQENEALQLYAHEDDLILQLKQNNGPTAILKGNNPTRDVLSIAAGLIQRYSKFRDQTPVEVDYWQVRDRNHRFSIHADVLTEDQISKMQI